MTAWPMTGKSSSDHPITNLLKDPAKFNAQTGREEARKDAVNKLWPMVVYAERERLSSQ